MPILYKVVTALLALSGCTSLLITGQLNPVMITGGLALIPGYFRYFKGMQPAPRLVIGGLSALTFCVFLFDTVMVTGDVFLAVAHLSITFQGLKSFDLKDPWDHLQVFFMSLLQLIIASELTRSLMFGVVFLFFLVVMAIAMVLSHYLKEKVLGRVSVRNPIIAVTLVTLSLTALIFVLIPRTPQRFIGKGQARGIKTSGFSERVEFGSFGEVKLDPTVVMRIALEARPARPLYWRGLTMDSFDGRSWRDTDHSRMRYSRQEAVFRVGRCPEGPRLEQRVYLEPIDTEVMFGVGLVCEVETDMPGLFADSASSYFLPGASSRRVSYRVRSDTTLRPEGRPGPRYLQRPPNTERIAALARQVSASASSDESRSRAIELYLRSSYRYSLVVSPPSSGMGVIDDFLFVSKKGYCEHFATAMVLMLRTLGIPARIVNGFAGGDWNEYGAYLAVRQSDAHSWVEALIKGKWETFDPTPPSESRRPAMLALLIDSIRMGWARYVVGFSSADQRSLLEGLEGGIEWLSKPRVSMAGVRALGKLVAVLAAIAVCVFLLRFRRRATKRFDTKYFLRLRRLLEKKGTGLTGHATAAEILERGSDICGEKDLKEFLVLYEISRFSGNEMNGDERKRYRELFGVMRERIRKRG